MQCLTDCCKPNRKIMPAGLGSKWSQPKPAKMLGRCKNAIFQPQPQRNAKIFCTHISQCMIHMKRWSNSENSRRKGRWPRGEKIMKKKKTDAMKKSKRQKGGTYAPPLGSPPRPKNDRRLILKHCFLRDQSTSSTRFSRRAEIRTCTAPGRLPPFKICLIQVNIQRAMV
jgi:hypothetical protein